MRHAFAPHGQIAAHFIALRNAGQAERYRLACNHQHALVAVFDGGKKFLHHHALGAIFVQRFGDGAQVQSIFLDSENSHATHAVQRLEDDVLMQGVKALDVTGIAGDQRRADELRKFKNRQLLRVVAQRTRFVEDARAFAPGLLQQMCGVKIFGIKRWILAHNDCIKLRQGVGTLVRAGLFGCKPHICSTGQRYVAHKRGHFLTLLPADVFGLADRQSVPAPLRLAHHGESGVLVDFEGFQRVGDKQDMHDLRQKVGLTFV